MTAIFTSSQATPLRLPEVHPQHVGTLNKLFRHREAFETGLASRMLSITPSWNDTLSIAEPCTITLQIGEQMGELVVPKALLEAVFSDFELSVENFDETQRALLLEFACADAFDMLSAALGVQLAMTGVRLGGSKVTSERLTLPLSLQFEGGKAKTGVLHLLPDDMTKLASLVDTVDLRDRSLLNVSLPLHVRWAVVTLTLNEIKSLMPGDIVLVDNVCRQEGRAVVVIGERLTVPVDRLAEGCRLMARPRPAEKAGWDWLLDRKPDGMHPISDGRRDDIPLLMMFEFGQLNMPLSAVAELVAGEVLPITAPANTPLDIIVNGARIGRGEVTNVGDALGIRVTRLMV